MTDDQGDAEFEASLAGLEGDGEVDFGEDGADGSLAGRLDSVQWAISNLGMRVDALVTSTTTYRSALTERLDEYTDVLTTATRNQAGELEEYRRATERALNEIRRGVGATEAAVAALSGRVDGLPTTGEPPAAGPGLDAVLSAQEALRARLDETAAALAASNADQIRQSQTAITEAIAGLRELASRGGTGDAVGLLKEDLAQIRAIAASIAERDPGAEVRGLHDEVASLRQTVAQLAEADTGAAIRDAVATVTAGLDRLAARLEDRGDQDEVLARLADVSGQLTGLADQVSGQGAPDASSGLEARLAALEESIAGLATSRQLGELTGNLRAQLADAANGLGPGGSQELAGAVKRLDEALLDVASGEVVGALWDEVRGLRAEFGAEMRDVLAAMPEVDLSGVTQRVDTVAGQLDALRSDLGEGLVVEPAPELMEALAALQTDLHAPAGSPADATDLTPVLDAIEDLRGRVGTGAAAPAPPGDLETELVVDLSAIEELVATIRADVQATAGVSDQVVDALRDELKALRRRIAVKADEKILSDAQLQVIADAVAARLAES